MAKADKLTSEEKSKKRASKSSDENPAAQGDAPVDSASQKTGGDKDKVTATAPDATGSAPPAGAAAASALDPALLPAQRGKVGIFGGPKDRGIKPDDKLALPTGRHFTFERVRSLNPKGFYCAMRWDYHALGKSNEEGKRWWANKKLLVTNPTSGVSIVVRAVDYGPPESTGLSIGLSPGAAEALGVAVGDEVEIAFADARLPAGVVE